MSAARYIVSSKPPRQIAAGDDWYPETRETVTVIVEDDKPTDTGLIDQHGVPIYRVPNRERCGY